MYIIVYIYIYVYYYIYMYTYIYVFISMTYDSMYPLANQICLAGKSTSFDGFPV